MEGSLDTCFSQTVARTSTAKAGERGFQVVVVLADLQNLLSTGDDYTVALDIAESNAVAHVVGVHSCIHELVGIPFEFFYRRGPCLRYPRSLPIPL